MNAHETPTAIAVACSSCYIRLVGEVYLVPFGIQVRR